MAAGFTGMDIEEVRRLAGEFRQMAGEIERINSQLTQRVNDSVGNTWKGPDAQKFQGDWTGTHTNQLRQVQTALENICTVAEQNATQQEQASA